MSLDRRMRVVEGWPGVDCHGPYRFVVADDDREMCVICSELPATQGIYCRRCAQGLEDDRYERECNR